MKMKKLLKMCALLLFLAVPRAHAQLAVVDGAVALMIDKTGADQIVYYVQMIAQQIENVKNTYAQVQMMIDAEKRALNNLKGIADVKNFDDFMKWQNRQLEMEREAENRFNNMGVKIGGKTYTVTELDKIPGALHNTFGDPYWDDFTEEQRASMYHQLGLSPANYNYVKLWSAREDYYIKRFLTRADTLADENALAAANHKNMIGQYREENENMDTNQILKNLHISFMQTENVLRDISHALAEKDRHEYELRKLGKTPPNKPHYSEHWNDDLFPKITDDDWTEE
jgi:hypothetical protein